LGIKIGKHNSLRKRKENWKKGTELCFEEGIAKIGALNLEGLSNLPKKGCLAFSKEKEKKGITNN